MLSWRLSFADPTKAPSHLWRDSVGGPAWLPKGAVTPSCTLCATRLTLVFQADLPVGHPLAGRHLVVLTCPKHDDIWGGIYEDGIVAHPAGRLPKGYWNGGGHYHLATYAGELVALASDGRLEPTPLELGPDPEPKKQAFRLGGHAPYVDKLAYTCSCGAKMVQVGEVPNDFKFPLAPGQAAQPGTFSTKNDKLFLGNYVLLMACSASCDPMAMVAYHG